jgi:CRISPR-associated protein (TIGR02584 family)
MGAGTGKSSVSATSYRSFDTSVGREQVTQELFTPQPHFNNQCGWECLRQKLQDQGHNLQGKLRFDPASDDLRVLTRWEENSHRKLPLSDIRTASENDAVADYILEALRGLVENPDTRLVASIAGGRKTMGTLLYACMTLIGRETDRLTHVLVNEPFDGQRLSPKFYFPEQPAANLVTPENNSVQAKDARITLADLPFVPLRSLFAKEFGRMPGRFLALVAKCREGVRHRAAAELKLVVYRSRAEIEINNVSVKLSAKQHLVALFLADRCRSGQPPFATYKEAVDLLNEYRQQLQSEARENDFSDWRHSNGIASDFNEEEIRKAVSSLRVKLKNAGPNAMALVSFLPEAGRFSIDLARKQVSIVR